MNYVNNWSIEIDIIDLYHFFVLWANPRVAGVWVTTRCYFIDRFSYSLLTCFQNGLSPFLPPGFCLLTIVKHVTQVTSHILLRVTDFPNQFFKQQMPLTEIWLCLLDTWWRLIDKTKGYKKLTISLVYGRVQKEHCQNSCFFTTFFWSHCSADSSWLRKYVDLVLLKT